MPQLFPLSPQIPQPVFPSDTLDFYHSNFKVTLDLLDRYCAIPAKCTCRKENNLIQLSTDIFPAVGFHDSTSGFVGDSLIKRAIGENSSHLCGKFLRVVAYKNFV